MQYRVLAAFVFCTVLTFGSGPVPAFAASTASPVRIKQCYVNVPRGALYPFTQVAITFTNQRALPANEVRFVVVYDGLTTHITDRGTFSQNVAIDHAFKAYDAPHYYGLLPERCEVEYVRYADGTTWPPATNREL